jgi:hypothetical protein
MASFKVYLVDLVKCKWPAYLREPMKDYFNRVVNHGDNRSNLTEVGVEYLNQRSMNIVQANDLVVYFVKNEDESVVKGFIKEKDPKANVPPGSGVTIRAFGQTFRMESEGFTVFTNTEACSEVYVGKISSRLGKTLKWKLAANLAFHELMHNLCRKSNDALHNEPGVKLGQAAVSETWEPSDADLSLMAKHLGKGPLQWKKGRSYWHSDPSRIMAIP